MCSSRMNETNKRTEEFSTVSKGQVAKGAPGTQGTHARARTLAENKIRVVILFTAEEDSQSTGRITKKS